jgi:hypothetical protein
MATVTNQLTRIHDVEGALSLTSIGGGTGASANTDIFLQGSQSVGRRASNVTEFGFWLASAVGHDVSSTSTHVRFWIWVTHYQSLTLIRMRIGTGTTNYNYYTYSTTNYPDLGGWVPIWVDVNNPTATGGSGLTNTNATQWAFTVSIPAVGGNVHNIIMDAIDRGTAGLLLTGTSGLISDFVTVDANATNQYGVIRSFAGVNYVYARLTFGSSSSLEFDDSAFTIVFPQQDLVATDWMGLTFDLQHASTDISIADAVIKSSSPAATRKGDLVVTGTSGVFDMTNSTLDSLRVITLTSACSLNGCSILASGQITAAGANITNSTITNSTTTSALLWDTNYDTFGKLDGTSFASSGTGHAIELGSNTPTSITFDDLNFIGYAATDGSTGNEALYNNSGKHITVNITGGNIPSVRNGSGATTTLEASVPLTINVIDTATNPIQSAQVAIYLSSDDSELVNMDTDVNGEVSSTYGGTTPASVYIRARKSSTGATKYIPASTVGTITSSGFSTTITLRTDPNA